MNTSSSSPVPVVLIPALLCDDGLHRDVVERLGEPTMPALVLLGEEDAIAPVAVGRALADGLPQARFEVLSACGHLPTLEKPAEAAAHFRRLLDDAGL